MISPRAATQIGIGFGPLQIAMLGLGTTLTEEEIGDPLYGTGGPDDASISPRARKYLREKYRRVAEIRPPLDDEPSVRRIETSTRIIHDPEVIAQLKRDITAAAREAIRAKVDRHNRRAVAMILAMLDD